MSSNNSLVHGVAGAGAGCLSLAITYPLYTATVTLQAQSDNHSNNSNKKQQQPTSVHSLQQQQRYSSISSTLSVLYNVHGFQGWYPGLKAALIANTIQSSVFYYFFSLCKNLHNVNNQPVWQMIVGMEAGVLNVLLTNPLWVINTRQMTMKKHTHLRRLSRASDDSIDSDDILGKQQELQAKSWTACAKHIYNNEGLSGFYSGVIAALALTINPASQFAIYELLKQWLVVIKLYIYLRIYGKNVDNAIKYKPTLNSIDIFVLGALAKVFSTIITYPLQTIKTQMQKQNTEHKTLYECVNSLYNNGIKAFYSGMSSKVLQTATTAAFLFACYDKIVDLVVRSIDRYNNYKIYSQRQ